MWAAVKRKKIRRRRKKGKTKRWPQRWMLYPTWQAKIISHYSKFDAPLTRTCRPWGERYTFYLFVAWYRLFSPYLFSSFYLQAAKVFPVRNSNSLMHLQNLKKKNGFRFVYFTKIIICNWKNPIGFDLLIPEMIFTVSCRGMSMVSTIELTLPLTMITFRMGGFLALKLAIIERKAY